MGGKGAGFASLSRKRLTEVSAKGGNNAKNSPLKHTWNKEAAKAAGQKGLLMRKVRQAAEAKTRLFNLGFDTADLDALKLTYDEYIYFGGKTAKDPKRREELKERIDAYKLQQHLD